MSRANLVIDHPWKRERIKLTVVSFLLPSTIEIVVINTVASFKTSLAFWSFVFILKIMEVEYRNDSDFLNRKCR